MSASRYVGRVGGLAVALGIGVALCGGGAGVAWASPEDPSAASERTAGQDSARSHVVTPRRSDAGQSGRVGPGSERVADVPGAVPSPVVVGPAPIAPRALLGLVRNGSGRPAPIPIEKSPVLVGPELGRPRPATVVTAKVSSAAPTQESLTAQPVAAGVVESMPALVPDPGPFTPPVSALSWSAAAAARREIGQPGEAANISTAVVSAHAVTANATPSFGDIIQYTLFHRSASARPMQDPGRSPAGIVTGFLNAESPDGGPLIYTVAQPPAQGSVEIGPDGSYTYTSGGGRLPTGGTDSFSVTIDNGSAYRLDGFGGAIQAIFMAVAQIVGLRQPDTVTVSVPVSIVNAAPVAGTPVVGLPDPASGLVTGQVMATDADGDTLTYSAVAATARGSAVSINPLTGAYTYTPSLAARNAAAAAYASTETFTVTVIDGYGGSLAVPVAVPVLPGSAGLRFNFTYGAGSEYWSPQYRQALQISANYLASHFLVTSPVVVTCEVIGVRESDNSALGWVSSPFSRLDDGSWEQAVAAKVRTGLDPNGGNPDAQITINFDYGWSSGVMSGIGYDLDSVDLESVVLHELLHPLGFSSLISYSDLGTYWTSYDTLLTDVNGTRLIGQSIPWNPVYATNLTGGNGGLFFGGPIAAAVYGGLVPVYTPSELGGASICHLDTPTPVIMNVGTNERFRAISPVEQGILKDLGYNIISQPPLYSMAILGFGLLGSRPRRIKQLR